MVRTVSIGVPSTQGLSDPYADAARQQAYADALKAQAIQPFQARAEPTGNAIGRGLIQLATALMARRAGQRADMATNQAEQGTQDTNTRLLNSLFPVPASAQPAPFQAPDLSQVPAPTMMQPPPAPISAQDQATIARRDLLSQALSGQDPRTVQSALSGLAIQRAIPPVPKFGFAPAGSSVVDENTGQVSQTLADKTPQYEPDRTLVKVVDKSNPAGYSTKLRSDFKPGVDNEYTPPPAALVAANQVPQNALQLAADTYRTTGKWPSNFMRSPILQGKALALVASDAEANGDTVGAMAARSAGYKANEQALGMLSKQSSAMDAAETGANRQFDLVLKRSAAVDRTGSPLINRAIVAWKSGAEGDPDTRQLILDLKEAQSQFAKVLQGAYGAAGITDTSARDAGELFNKIDSAQTLQAMLGPGGDARIGMANRTGGLHAQQEVLRGQLGRGAPGVAGIVPPVPSAGTAPVTKTINGVTYTQTNGKWYRQ